MLVIFLGIIWLASMVVISIALITTASFLGCTFPTRLILVKARQALKFINLLLNLNFGLMVTALLVILALSPLLTWLDTL